MAMKKALHSLEEGVSRFFSRENVDKYYDLKKEIGSGNFSIVKLAVNRKTGEEVAVKIIEKKRVGTKKDMLQTEIDILQKVHHPNVVALRELFETSTHIYLVMELVTGGELFDRIVERGSFSEKDAQKVMKQVFDGIDYLHSMGVAHRDLKPENLLCSSKDVATDVKITDFGLSKLLPADAHMKMTTACGTPGYVAPEVLQMQGYGVEVDLWSCGVIMYIMLCGFPPFYADNNALLFEKIMRGEFAFLSPYWDKISKDAKDLIRRLLTVDASKRLTASLALQHPWFTGTACAETPVTAETLKKMREYNQSRKAMNVRPNMAPDPTSAPEDTSSAAPAAAAAPKP